MKVVKKRVHCTPIEFVSANNLLSLKLDYNNGPELELEDGSVLVFMDTSIYYNIIIGDVPNEVNVDVLKLKYFSKSDDVANVVYEGRDIIEVEDYIYKDNHFYRLLV